MSGWASLGKRLLHEFPWIYCSDSKAKSQSMGCIPLHGILEVNLLREQSSPAPHGCVQPALMLQQGSCARITALHVWLMVRVMVRVRAVGGKQSYTWETAAAWLK